MNRYFIFCTQHASSSRDHGYFPTRHKARGGDGQEEKSRGRPTGVRSPSCADARCENATTADDADVVAATVESENSKFVV